MRRKAFTLIELLIVVAIIAILAAIAIPNFLEAQTRSKVSRCAADMRSIRVALEAYRVDSNTYPETDWGETNLLARGCGMIRLTTPVAFITSVPKSPFREDKIGGGSTRHCTRNIMYLYTRALPSGSSNDPDNSPSDGVDDNYQRDRVRYLKGQAIAPGNLEFSRMGSWNLKSVGPDNKDDFSTLADLARVYDATNGTISDGDILVFSDTAGFGQQQQ